MPKAKRNKPQLIVFDLDNTVYEYEQCNVAGEQAFVNYAADILGISHRTARKNLVTAKKNVKMRISGASSHDRTLYIAEFLSVCSNVNDARFILEGENHYWSNYFSKMKIAPYCRDVIMKARLNQIVTALVTDLTSNIQYRKLVHLGVDNLFDVIVTSQETMQEKDTFEPFALLIDRLMVKEFNEVWFIGDSNSDFPDTFNAQTKVYFGSPFAEYSKLKSAVIKIQSYKKILKLLE
jgi:putative hydrolase of the HAD superfamily